MWLKISLIFSLFIVVCFSAVAQSTSTDSIKNRWKPAAVTLKDPSLKGQYEYLLSRSKYTRDGYRAIANYRLNQFWINVNDTISRQHKQLTTLNKKVIEHEKTITYLKTNLADKEKLTETSVSESSHISFLGIKLKKEIYQITVWGIIGLLTLAVVICVARITKNNIVVREKVEAYNQISSEFQQYKSKAVEKERKLARELQDERNKLDEMKGHGKL
jgi:hypothetical protein